MRASSKNPSNSMIERLLKDLFQYVPRQYGDDEDTAKLREEEKEIETKLMKNPRLMAIQKRIKQNTDRRSRLHESMVNEIRDVRTMFLAHGASEGVLHKAQALAAKFRKNISK